MEQRETVNKISTYKRKEGSETKTSCYKGKCEKVRNEPEISICCLLAQPAGCQTGEFQAAMKEQRDMMTSLHKLLQSLQLHSFSTMFSLHSTSLAKQ